MSKTPRVRRPKHTHEYIKKEFAKFGYTLQTKTYVGSKQPLRVVCKNGHISTVCWNNFSRGNRCKKCFMESCARKNQGRLKPLVLKQKHYTVSEAARILGVRYEDLRNHIIQGLLPGPKHVIGKVKKHYRMEDIKEIENLIE